MAETIHTIDEGLEGRVRRVAERVVEDLSLYLEGVTVRGRKGSRVVEVYVDSDQGLTIDEAAQVSRRLGEVLEVEDTIDGKYHLNVSSPGATSPLTLARHFKKNVGRVIRVKYTEGEENKEISGELKFATDDTIQVELKDGRMLSIPQADITEARVQLPW